MKSYSTDMFNSKDDNLIAHPHFSTSSKSLSCSSLYIYRTPRIIIHFQSIQEMTNFKNEIIASYNQAIKELEKKDV